MVILEVKNLGTKYGTKQVLSDVSFQVGQQEILVVLGQSGCGKTTLLKSITGLLRPDTGVVKLFDTVMGELDDEKTGLVLRKIGMLYQNGALLGSLTVGDNVALPLAMHSRLPRPVIAEIVAHKLAQVGLPDAGALYPQELSGGMRKRAALARALALDPPLLFCDEPTAGLDPVSASGIDELLLRLRATLKITIVVVTHELLSIKAIADSLIFLHKGTLLFKGSLNEATALHEGPVHEFFNRKTAPSAVETVPNRNNHISRGDRQ